MARARRIPIVAAGMLLAVGSAARELTAPDYRGYVRGTLDRMLAKHFRDPARWVERGKLHVVACGAACQVKVWECTGEKEYAERAIVEELRHDGYAVPVGDLEKLREKLLVGPRIVLPDQELQQYADRVVADAGGKGQLLVDDLRIERVGLPELGRVPRVAWQVIAAVDPRLRIVSLPRLLL